MYAHIYILKVEPREEECFYDDLLENESVELNVYVIRGGLLDIMLDVS